MRYFFHLDIGRQSILDEDGVVLADNDAARREALLIARDFVDRRGGDVHSRWRGTSIHVRDERDELVFTLPLAEASAFGLCAALSLAKESEAAEAAVIRLNGHCTQVSDRASAARRLGNESRALRLAHTKLMERLRFAVRDLTSEIELARERRHRARELLERSQAQTRSVSGSA